jgi:hypothetical protein
MIGLAARLLLDLGRVQKRGHDGGRADAYGYARLYQFRPAFFGRLVSFVGHGAVSMAFGGALEAA